MEINEKGIFLNWIMNCGLPSLLRVSVLFLVFSVVVVRGNDRGWCYANEAEMPWPNYLLMFGTWRHIKVSDKKNCGVEMFLAKTATFFFIARDKQQGFPLQPQNKQLAKKTFHLWIFYCLYVSVSLKATLNHFFYWRLVEARFSFKLIIKHARFSHQRESLFALIPQ